MSLRNARGGMVAMLLAALPLSFGTAHAEDIAAVAFGSAANGIPWAVVLEKGYFKEEGVDIGDVISTNGGGPDLRVLLGGKLPFAESGLSAVADADAAGADLVIVSSDANTVADINFVVMPASPLQSIKDIKGKRLGYTNPGSTTEALAYSLIDHLGFANGDVKYVATGSLGAALTALGNNGIDVAPITVPAQVLSGSKYRVLAKGRDIFPPISNTVGVVSRSIAEKHPEVVRGIIAARRKAVEFMHANPHEASAMIAKHYKMTPDDIEQVITYLMNDATVNGVPYWGPGKVEYESLGNLAKAMKLIGAIKGDVDLHKLVDERYLPDDQKSKN